MTIIIKSITRLLIPGIFSLILAGCVATDQIYSHEFSSGYYKLKNPGKAPENIYLDLNKDSVSVYHKSGRGKSLNIDLSSPRIADIKETTRKSWLFNNTFVRTSADIDLSTVLLKIRPHAGNVPTQMSTNVNGVGYIGFRKDYFRVKTRLSKTNKEYSFIRHTGFDFGPLAGIGITQMNYTVTMNRNLQEYDGIVFEKGFGIFGTYENMSVGISMGFDNLLDHNRDIWVFEKKPWFGLVIGIANF